MKCTCCGRPIVGGARFCHTCGAPVPPAPAPDTGKQTAALVLGIISLVCAAGGGIVFLLTWMIEHNLPILYLLLGIPGLVCGLIALGKASKSRREFDNANMLPSPMLKAGRTCGIIGVILSAVLIAALIVSALIVGLVWLIFG